MNGWAALALLFEAALVAVAVLTVLSVERRRPTSSVSPETEDEVGLAV